MKTIKMFSIISYVPLFGSDQRTAVIFNIAFKYTSSCNETIITQNVVDAFMRAGFNVLRVTVACELILYNYCIFDNFEWCYMLSKKKKGVIYL